MSSGTYFKNEVIELWLENGIVYAIYTKNAVITLEIAKEIVYERLRIVGARTYPSLSDYTGNMQITKEARAFFASSESIKQVSAGAFLVKNLIQQFLGNAFLKFNKPTIPARIFSNKEDAIKWLEFYKNLN